MRSNEFKRFSSQSQAMYALLDTRFKDKYFFHSLFSLHTHDLLSFCVFHTQTHTSTNHRIHIEIVCTFSYTTSLPLYRPADCFFDIGPIFGQCKMNSGTIERKKTNTAQTIYFRHPFNILRNSIEAHRTRLGNRQISEFKGNKHDCNGSALHALQFN